MNEGSILITIVLLPLFGSVLSFIIGSFAKKFSGLVASFFSALCFYFVFQATSHVADTGIALKYSSSVWFSISNLTVGWSLAFDQLTAVMCLLITGVGTLIHIFACGYMAKDEGVARFFSYLNLFLASMLLLVLGGNLPVLFIGWEGVGLCSYLLIGFWFSNPDYAKAAQKAFVMNRIGDLGLLICMFALFTHFQTLEISTIVDAIKNGALSAELLVPLGVLLLVGAFGKSAQLPLFTWLPDAMAGPTPVSALIHAATMVTAGIYLVARMHPIFSGTPELQLFIAVVATATAFITATIALVQNDIKKVLAYSTVSQLGFMFLALSAGAYWVAIFHVITHGFFKACLFLGAGSVIHGCHHEQDMRKMGGLVKKMPITFFSFTVATFAIAGIAPFAGYFSKHAILEAFATYAQAHAGVASYLPVLVGIITVTSFLTAFYMGRCWVLTFFGQYKGSEEHAPHEVSAVMWLPVLVLAGLSFFSGFVLQEPMADFLSAVLPAGPQIAIGSFGEALAHSWLGALGIALSVICFLLLPKVVASIAGFASPIVGFFQRSYFLDELYSLLVIKPLQVLGWIFWKVGDDLTLEAVEQSGVATTKISGVFGAWLQSGQVRQYALLLFLGLASLVYLLIHGF